MQKWPVLSEPDFSLRILFQHTSDSTSLSQFIPLKQRIKILSCLHVQTWIGGQGMISSSSCDKIVWDDPIFYQIIVNYSSNILSISLMSDIHKMQQPELQSDIFLCISTCVLCNQCFLLPEKNIYRLYKVPTSQGCWENNNVNKVAVFGT